MSLSLILTLGQVIYKLWFDFEHTTYLHQADLYRALQVLSRKVSLVRIDTKVFPSGKLFKPDSTKKNTIYVGSLGWKHLFRWKMLLEIPVSARKFPSRKVNIFLVFRSFFPKKKLFSGGFFCLRKVVNSNLNVVIAVKQLCCPNFKI